MDVYPTGWESSQLAIKKKGLATIKKKAELKDELQKNSMERLKEKEKDELQKANEKKKTSITPGLVSMIQRKTIEVVRSLHNQIEHDKGKDQGIDQIERLYATQKEKDELQKANEKKKTSITPGLVSLIQRKTIEVAKEEKQRAKTTKMSASSRTSRVPSSSIVLVK